MVQKRGRKPKQKQGVGVDIGLINLASTSTGQHYGQISEPLRRRVEWATAKGRHKQKLNACLKRQGKPTLNLTNQRAEAFARNEIGQALNRLIADLPPDAAAAVERLTVKDMRFKSRQMNRWLKAGQWGYARDKLKFKLDEARTCSHGIRYRSVQPAYARQECSQGGFVSPMNRRTQADFECLGCGYKANADKNAAANLAKRFDDEALNALPFCDLGTELAIRFMRRLPDARSASAGLELQPIIWLPRGKGVVALDELPPTVNQPG